MKYKKGGTEPAGDIAALILLILLSTVIYIVLIPPAEREALLGTDNETAGKTPTGISAEQTLLSASPGQVHPFKKGTIRKEITPVSLFTKVEDKIVNLATSLTVSKSPFSEQVRQLSFRVDDINNLDSAKLFLFIKDASGEIFIELNGNIIYEGKLASENVPILLPTSSLKANNIIRFGTKNLFWSKYILSDIYVKTSYLYENTQVKRTFEISTREKSNIEKAKFEYYINCLGKEQGILSVILNSKLLTDDYIVCGIGKRTLEISSRDLVFGTNVIEFRVDKGNYDIEALELVMDVGEKVFPAYNFEITNEIYKKVFNSCYVDCESDCNDDCGSDTSCFSTCISDCTDTCDRVNVILEMTFSGDERKKAAITINEFEISMNTQSSEYVRVISDYIRRGDNVIKIVPKSDFDIGSLQIFVG